MPPRPIRVAVAHGREIPRRALASLLASLEGVAVVAEAATAADALECVLAADPDVVVMDLTLAGPEGLEPVRRVRDAHPRTETVLLAAALGEGLPRRAFEAGARGVVWDGGPVESLFAAIGAAAVGDYYLAGPTGPEPAEEHLEAVLERQPSGGLVTPRERQLACLLADGYSTKEAAAALNISVRTAETHRASILRKLGARNVADIVKYCIRNGLIDF